MANNSLTPSYLAAPQLETGRVVIEASAGTGKTYSLTVLVVRHVAERGLTADQLLMVTFTNAATAELREKTRDQAQKTLHNLRNNYMEHSWMATMLETPESCATAITNLQAFLSHFDDTTITTIHGFCQIVLRRAGLNSPAPQNYLVQDNVDEIINEVITDLLIDPMSKNISELNTAFVFKTVTKDYVADQMSEDFSELLMSFENNDESRSPTSSDVRSSLSQLHRAVKRRMGNPSSVALPTLTSSNEQKIWLTDLEQLKKDLRISEALEDAKRALQHLEETKQKSKYKKDVNEATKTLKDAKKNIEVALRKLEQTKHALNISNWVDKVIAEVHRRSYNAGIMTYDDMVRMVAETLEKNDTVAINLSQSISSHYSIMMVDEFQDTDALQWSIFSHIFEANPHKLTLITVGDPKQAIYRFRGADVQAYIDAVGSVEQNHKLGTNYRSDKGLLTALATLFTNGKSELNDSKSKYFFAANEKVPFEKVESIENGSVSSTSVHAPPNVPGSPLEIRYLANHLVLGSHTVPGSIKNGKIGEPKITNNDSTEVQRIFWRDMANHVVELLQHGNIPDKKSNTENGTRAITPNDIAILVNSHSDAETAVQYLRESSVPAVRFKTDSVFGSRAAMHWLMLLGALANPGKPQFVHAYAMSWFGNMSEEVIARADQDTLAKWQHDCAKNAELLRLRGIGSLYLSFRNRADFLNRVLGMVDGERHITDLDHVAEILASIPDSARNGSASDYFKTLTEFINNSDSRIEQFQRRIEGDEVAVKVMTIHSSKGLQFPVVFLPTLLKSSPSNDNNPKMFSSQFPGETTTRRIIDIASGFDGAKEWILAPIGKDNLPIASHEGRDLLFKDDVYYETKRLLYVALTRAEHKVVLYWSATGPNNGNGNIKVALAQTLAAHDSNLTSIPVEAEPLNALMKTIVGASHGTIAAIPLPSKQAPKLKWTKPSSTQRTTTTPAQYARTNKVSTSGFAQWSYSELSRTLKGDHSNKSNDSDLAGATDESNSAPTLTPLVSNINIALDVAIASMPLHDIAGSKTFGTTVHEVFDNINPASAKLNQDLYDQVEHHFANTHSPEQRTKIAGGIIASIHAPLGGPFAGNTLRTLGTTHRLSELEFNFHLPQSDARAFPLSDIGALMLQHGNLDPYLTAYAQDIVDNPSTINIAGYMTGSIDAVFRVNSEASDPVYVVADYKTNFLHRSTKAQQNPLTPYHPDNLVISMVEHGFILQALVYSVALHRYLRWRQPGYVPDIHLGGTAYLYIRGMTGHSTDDPIPRPYGVYHWRPTTALVLALDALFAGKGN